MDTEKLIQEMTRRIIDGFAPQSVILFGSYAREDANPQSDVDLLVVISGEVDKRKTSIAIRQALADLPIAKDILVTTPDEIARRGRLVGSVLRPALMEGKILYERS
jgi:uncharacterized protein